MLAQPQIKKYKQGIGIFLRKEQHYSQPNFFEQTQTLSLFIALSPWARWITLRLPGTSTLNPRCVKLVPISRRILLLHVRYVLTVCILFSSKLPT